MKNASILFYSLILMFFLITIVLVMVFLFTTQVGTLRIVKEGSNAYYAAQSGVENARNVIHNTTLHKEICGHNCHLNIPPNCPRQSKVIPKTYLKTYDVNDTSYSVGYWFTCYHTVSGTPPNLIYAFFLHNYQITSWGTFGDAKREIIVTRDQL